MGHVDGGDEVEICGLGILAGDSAPSVWIGNRSARAVVWGGGCVTVSTPPGLEGAADIAYQHSNSRPQIAEEAFTYRSTRLVRLERGWNDVSWTGGYITVERAFASLEGVAFRAYQWDAVKQAWKTYSPDLPRQLNTLVTLDRLQTVTIYLDAPARDWEQPAAE